MAQGKTSHVNVTIERVDGVYYVTAKRDGHLGEASGYWLCDAAGAAVADLETRYPQEDDMFKKGKGKKDDAEKVFEQAEEVTEKLMAMDPEEIDKLMADEPVGMLLIELTRMYHAGQMAGLFVAVMRPDGRVYPHLVGKTDDYRMLGVIEAFMHRELRARFEGDFVGRSWKGAAKALRRELEKGV